METPSEPSFSQPALPVSLPNPAGSIVPFCVYVFFLLWADFLGSAVMRTEMAMPTFLDVAFTSFVLGQIVLAIIIGGLMGDNWLEGILSSAAAVTCGICLSMLAAGASINADSLLYMAGIPCACLVAASPLILLRWTIGWRLRQEGSLTPRRSSLTIEDMILVPASLVDLCVLAFASTIDDRDQIFFMGIASPILPLPMLCLIFIPPCTFWAFRVEDVGIRWLLCLGYPLALVILVVVCIAVFSRGFPAEVVAWSVYCTLVTSGVAMLGLQILYTSGYRLTNFARAAAQLQAVPESAAAQSTISEPSPFDVEVAATSNKPLGDPLTAAIRKRHRIAVAILLVGTAIVNTAAWTYKRTEHSRSLERVVANGGTVEMANGKPIRITFGPQTTEADLLGMPSMPSVKSISLAGTKVKNAWFFDMFRSLESIDIRNTNIAPQSLRIRNIEIVVSEGQYSASDVKEFTSRGISITEIATP